jgi:hypothetical protein
MGDMNGGSRGQEGRNSSGSSSGKNYILIAVTALIVIAILVGVIVYLLIGRKEEPVAATGAPEEDKREVLVTEDNVKEVAEQLEQQEYVPQGYYTVTQNYEWHFPKGDQPSTDAHVENLPENTNDVYFDLFLADNDETPIYQSPVIPLGAVLEDFKLDTKLDPGTYDCVMVYHLVDEKQNTISTVSMTVKVIVEG